MGEPRETAGHEAAQNRDSTPAEIRRKVAAYQIYKQAARRRRHGWFRAALLLAVLSLAAPLLIRNRHGLAHGCRSWLTHAHRRHHHHYVRRSY